LKAFANAPALAGLERLNVWTQTAKLDGLKQLVESPHLRGLRGFTLGHALITPEATANQVGHWNWFPNLRELTFDSCSLFGEFTPRLLQKSAWISHLERLSLTAAHDDSGQSVFEAIGDGRLKALVDLSVERVHTHAEVFASVLKLDRPRLQSLQLRDILPGDNPRTDRTGRLFRAPWLRELRRLELVGTLHDQWLVAIADAPFAKTLRVLDVGSAVFAPAGFRDAFGPKREWPELQRLNVQYTRCPEEVLASLVDHDGLPKLVSLRAGWHTPATKFLARLAKSPASARFRELSLDVKMDDATADALVKSPHLENIDILRIVKGTAGRTACNRLQRRFGSRITIEPNRG